MAGYVWKGWRPEPEETPVARPLKPHGTTAAYKRHLASGEQPCEQCAIGRRQEEANYRATKAKSKPRQLSPCGTRGAYERHKRRGEQPDEACRLAASEARRQNKRLARGAA